MKKTSIQTSTLRVSLVSILALTGGLASAPASFASDTPLESTSTQEVSTTSNSAPVLPLDSTSTVEEHSVVITPGTPSMSRVAFPGGDILVANPEWWEPMEVEIAYQWYRDDVPVEGETDFTYQLTEADYNSTISVAISGSHPDALTVTKFATQVLHVGDTGLSHPKPSIIGEVNPGKTVVAASNYDEPNTTYYYQWYADGDFLYDGWSESYELTNAEAGKSLTVEVLSVPESGPMVSVVSDPIVVGGAIELPEPDPELTFTGTPLITGGFVFGDSLSIDPGTWTEGTALTYQWRRDCVDIEGATGEQYTITGDDAGHLIDVVVTGSKEGYPDKSIGAWGSDFAKKATLESGYFMMSGTLPVGGTLTSILGTWTEGTSLSYQWYRDGELIDGATNPKYITNLSDIGKHMELRVTGTKEGYEDKTITYVVNKVITE